jgi:hypothetical protein
MLGRTTLTLNGVRHSILAESSRPPYAAGRNQNFPVIVINTVVNNTYLNWVAEKTKTQWWHDSAADAELDRGLQRGAIGVTTNPVLAAAALKQERDSWSSDIQSVFSRNLPSDIKAEEFFRFASGGGSGNTSSSVASSSSSS